MKEFFDYIRLSFGSLNQKQVEGFELLVNRTKDINIKHRAYILATTWHETARTMQPIREYGKGAGKKYGVPDSVTGETYYGRGYVQLTWKENYIKAEKRLKELGLIGKQLNFVKNPDEVMKPAIAAHILVIGMVEGWFTTHKLSDFNTYESMRRIVNGTDKAKQIAEYAVIFENALTLLKEEPIKLPIPDVEPVVKPENIPIKGNEKSIAAIIIGAIFAIFAAFAAWLIGGK